ncbi:MAG: hypothetical protein R6V83_07230 [Candidatus Thorarchaeota archaeon]
MSVMGHLGGGDNVEVGDHDHAVVRTVESLTVAGMMTRDKDRSKKPGPREESHSCERGQSPC